MNDRILESENIKYKVLLNGQTLTEAQSRNLAENFVSTLTAEQQKNVQIVPITEGGKQLLFT
jgi:hypothetical protein|tara:strand:- start:933 stop:1118 length:186 start_codon:yes stop_codon:yes gene_type:complete